MTTLFEYILNIPYTEYSSPSCKCLTITTDRIETNRWYTRDIIVNKHSIIDYTNFVVCRFGHAKIDTILVYSKLYNKIFTFSVEYTQSIIVYDTDLYIINDNIPTYIVHGQGCYNIVNHYIDYDQRFSGPLACLLKYRLAIYDPKKVDYGNYIYPQQLMPSISLPLIKSYGKLCDITIV